MSILKKLNHLRLINSVDWRTAARTLVHLFPDYFSGKGRTRSLVNITVEMTYRCNWACDFCFLKDNVLSINVTLSMLIGATCAAPLSAWTVGGLKAKSLKVIIALVTLMLGVRIIGYLFISGENQAAGH